MQTFFLGFLADCIRDAVGSEDYGSLMDFVEQFQPVFAFGLQNFQTLFF